MYCKIGAAGYSQAFQNRVRCMPAYAQQSGGTPESP